MWGFLQFGARGEVVWATGRHWPHVHAPRWIANQGTTSGQEQKAGQNWNVLKDQKKGEERRGEEKRESALPFPLPSFFSLLPFPLFQIGSERFRAPEVLFNPSLVGSEFVGAHQCLVNSINLCDLDLRRRLFMEIVLAGGSSLFQGEAFLFFLLSFLRLPFKVLGLLFSCCFLQFSSFSFSSVHFFSQYRLSWLVAQLSFMVIDYFCFLLLFFALLCSFSYSSICLILLSSSFHFCPYFLLFVKVLDPAFSPKWRNLHHEMRKSESMPHNKDSMLMMFVAFLKIAIPPFFIILLHSICYSHYFASLFSICSLSSYLFRLSPLSHQSKYSLIVLLMMLPLFSSTCLSCLCLLLLSEPLDRALLSSAGSFLFSERSLPRFSSPFHFFWQEEWTVCTLNCEKHRKEPSEQDAFIVNGTSSGEDAMGSADPVVLSLLFSKQRLSFTFFFLFFSCRFSTWSGGSILASLNSFSRMWITRKEYDDQGPSIIFRKTF